MDENSGRKEAEKEFEALFGECVREMKPNHSEENPGLSLEGGDGIRAGPVLELLGREALQRRCVLWKDDPAEGESRCREDSDDQRRVTIPP